jgi:glycosyltransferase involved in cell wall biosynthesis
MKTSVVIPIFNEVDLLPTVLERVRALDFEKELILVDDLSIDGTRELLHGEEGKPDTTVLYHDVNRGKGAALRTGFASATGEVIIVQDADMEYTPEDMVRVLEPIWNGEVKVSYGSRFMSRVKDMRLANYSGNMVLAWLVRVMFWKRITDEATAYKAFHREVLKEIDLECERFEFCPEVTARVLRRGHKIVECPVSFDARSVAEGKKIGWRDFITAVNTLLRFRFLKF